jgi:hypothetical protein
LRSRCRLCEYSWGEVTGTGLDWTDDCFRPQETKRNSRRQAEEAWWANGGQGVYESDGEEETLGEKDEA